MQAYTVTQLHSYTSTELHGYTHGYLIFSAPGERGATLNCSRCRLSLLSSLAIAVLSSASSSMLKLSFGLNPKTSSMMDGHAFFSSSCFVPSSLQLLKPAEVDKKSCGQRLPITAMLSKEASAKSYDTLLYVDRDLLEQSQANLGFIIRSFGNTDEL